MTIRKKRLLVISAVTIFLTGCETVSGQSGQADAALAAGPLSLQQQAAEVRINQVKIEFAPRRATLTSENGRQLDLLVRLIRQVDPVILYATAYVDSGAGERGGEQLSARRALAVKRGLMARGVPEWQMRVQSVGLPAGESLGGAGVGRVTITWGPS